MDLLDLTMMSSFNISVLGFNGIFENIRNLVVRTKKCTGDKKCYTVIPRYVATLGPEPIYGEKRGGEINELTQ